LSLSGSPTEFMEDDLSFKESKYNLMRHPRLLYSHKGTNYPCDGENILSGI